MQFHVVRLTAVFALGAVSVMKVHAQGQIPYNDDWNFRIGIPLWAPSTHGTIGTSKREILTTPGPGPGPGLPTGTFERPEVHLDQNLIDTFESLDFVAALNLEVSKDRWLFFSDGDAFKISETGDPRGAFQGASVQVSQTYMVNDLALGYAVVSDEYFTLHLFAGAQISFASIDLSLNRPVADRTASDSDFWADPIVGVYLNYQFSRPAGFYTKANVGGFGVSSRLIWQVEGGFEFPFADYWYCRLAYRTMATDYEGKVKLDTIVRGPQVEFGVRF